MDWSWPNIGARFNRYVGLRRETVHFVSPPVPAYAAAREHDREVRRHESLLFSALHIVLSQCEYRHIAIHFKSHYSASML